VTAVQTLTQRKCYKFRAETLPPVPRSTLQLFNVSLTRTFTRFSVLNDDGRVVDVVAIDTVVHHFTFFDVSEDAASQKVDSFYMQCVKHVDESTWSSKQGCAQRYVINACVNSASGRVSPVTLLTVPGFTAEMCVPQTISKNHVFSWITQANSEEQARERETNWFTNTTMGRQSTVSSLIDLNVNVLPVQRSM